MFFTTQVRLILSFAGVSLLVGGLSLIVGVQIIDRAVLGEATNRVDQDLNAAWEIYNNRERRIALALKLVTLDQDFRSGLSKGHSSSVARTLRRIADEVSLDFAAVVAQGRVLYRMGLEAAGSEANRALNPVAELCAKRRAAVSGTLILQEAVLGAEDPVLAERARIVLLPTPRAGERPEGVESAGMAVVAAVPLFDDGRLIGVLYGGILLNRNTEIVDRIRDTLFRRETYHGSPIGTATIFLKDLRISTNVLDETSKRAIGTRVSREVRDQVLGRGERWKDRAFVVNNWYITAYDPIEDVFGERVGMLYVGVLEAKYRDIRRQALSVFIAITLAGLAVAILLGYVLGRIILRPVNRLIQASNRVSQGDLSPEIGPISKTEIGTLQKTFLSMLDSVRERVQRERQDGEIKLLQSEKQASVGRLAAGVAHEINNPLTGVLTFTHMLLQRDDLQEGMRSDLNTIADATQRVRRIVRGLLDFSRQTEMNPVPTEINELIRKSIALAENQAHVKGISLRFDPGDGIPVRTLDPSQMQSVIINILLNAVDATERGGSITVTSGLDISTGIPDQKGIEIVISDTGHGIASEHLNKLFDPFFTTKEVGKGTGLGLSVSHGIVEGHGGNIRVRSKLGQGSTFIIWLPLEGHQA